MKAAEAKAAATDHTSPTFHDDPRRRKEGVSVVAGNDDNGAEGSDPVRRRNVPARAVAADAQAVGEI